MASGKVQLSRLMAAAVGRLDCLIRNDVTTVPDCRLDKLAHALARDRLPSQRAVHRNLLCKFFITLRQHEARLANGADRVAHIILMAQRLSCSLISNSIIVIHAIPESFLQYNGRQGLSH